MILCDSNGWYDRLVDAYQRPTRKERVKALDSFDDGVKGLVVEWRSSFLLSMWENPRNGFSRTLSMAINSIVLTALTGGPDWEDRAMMRYELVKLAFALAEHRATEGEYPAALNGLVPKYVATVPRDLFNDGELHYERKGKGYTLYSVGVNGEDDGGMNYEKFEKHGDIWDDITIEMPAVKVTEM
jgi:hypothetical protein